MIGVIAEPSQHEVAREFFELFKTPWEFHRCGQRYDVILCASEGKFDGSAKLVLVYGSRQRATDIQGHFCAARQHNAARILCYKDLCIPIYGRSITVQGPNACLSGAPPSQDKAAYLGEIDGQPVVRIGYDLFCEIAILLGAGQPISNASVPTLDLHIALLRDLITASGVTLAEIPPVPKGYRFIACLTHDVDHPSVRKHRFDHTMFGFLFRATLGSVANLFKGRSSLRGLWTNLAAALKLPFVYLGLAKDFWEEFDRYPELEDGARSSFFVIPFKGCPGSTRAGLAPKRRASGYRAAEILGHIRKLKSAGCEVGLHGIDAWLDTSRGREELEEIRRITGAREIGVRMHWLYYDDQSPGILERAGADYDSTIGYNETVGYRAGTTQAFKPLDVVRMLELPLHIMDTALFYPTRLNLSHQEARIKVSAIVDHAVRLGGCVTINWHDRSLSPERCWDSFYVDLVDELKSKGAWLATASDAVSWFRKRRLSTFEDVDSGSGASHAKTSCAVNGDLPALFIRIYNRPVPR